MSSLALPSTSTFAPPAMLEASEKKIIPPSPPLRPPLAIKVVKFAVELPWKETIPPWWPTESAPLIIKWAKLPCELSRKMQSTPAPSPFRVKVLGTADELTLNSKKAGVGSALPSHAREAARACQ